MYEDAEEQSNWNTEIACNKVGNWFYDWYGLV